MELWKKTSTSQGSPGTSDGTLGWHAARRRDPMSCPPRGSGLRSARSVSAFVTSVGRVTTEGHPGLWRSRIVQPNGRPLAGISWRNGFTAVRKVRSESCNPPRSSRRICSDLCTSTAALRYLTLSRPNGANERR
jgi:hypothetical protein